MGPAALFWSSRTMNELGHVDQTSRVTTPHERRSVIAATEKAVAASARAASSMDQPVTVRVVNGCEIIGDGKCEVACRPDSDASLTALIGGLDQAEVTVPATFDDETGRWHATIPAKAFATHSEVASAQRASLIQDSVLLIATSVLPAAFGVVASAITLNPVGVVVAGAAAIDRSRRVAQVASAALDAKALAEDGIEAKDDVVALYFGDEDLSQIYPSRITARWSKDNSGNFAVGRGNVRREESGINGFIPDGSTARLEVLDEAAQGQVGWQEGGNLGVRREYADDGWKRIYFYATLSCRELASNYKLRFISNDLINPDSEPFEEELSLGTDFYRPEISHGISTRDRKISRAVVFQLIDKATGEIVQNATARASI